MCSVFLNKINFKKQLGSDFYYVFCKTQLFRLTRNDQSGLNGTNRPSFLFKRNRAATKCTVRRKCPVECTQIHRYEFFQKAAQNRFRKTEKKRKHTKRNFLLYNLGIIEGDQTYREGQWLTYTVSRRAYCKRTSNTPS